MNTQTNNEREKEEWDGWRIVSNMLDQPDENGLYPKEKTILSEQQRLRRMIYEQTNNKWEKELHKLGAMRVEFYENLKSFISDLLSSERQRLRERVEKMKIYDSDDTSRSVINMHGYNDALSDILKFLEEK